MVGQIPWFRRGFERARGPGAGLLLPNLRAVDGAGAHAGTLGLDRDSPWAILDTGVDVETQGVRTSEVALRAGVGQGQIVRGLGVAPAGVDGQTGQ